MRTYNMAFTGREHPVVFSPLTDKPSPTTHCYEPITVEADTLDGAAKAAKDWYEQYCLTAKRNPMFVEPADMGTITVMSYDGAGVEVGDFDYATLKLAGGFAGMGF